MQHIFLTNRNGLDRSRKTRSKLRKKSSNTSWKNCHKPVGLLICQISQVPNKFHKPLASDLWLNSQTDIEINYFHGRRPGLNKMRQRGVWGQSSPGSWRLFVIFRLNSKLKMPFKGQKYNCLLHIVLPQTCLSVILDIAS